MYSLSIFQKNDNHDVVDKVVIRGQTLCQNNRQLIGMSLIGLARQAKNRSQLYFLLKSSLSIWAYGGVKDHIMEL